MRKAVSLFDELLLEVTHDLKENKRCTNPTDFNSLHGFDPFASAPPGAGRTLSADERRDFAAMQLIKGLHKRYIGPTRAPLASESERRTRAVLEFLEDNTRCHDFNRRFAFRKLDRFTQEIVDGASYDIYLLLENPSIDRLSYTSISQRLRSGPGSSAGLSGNDTSSYVKFCTSEHTSSSQNISDTFRVATSFTRLGYLTRKSRGVDENKESSKTHYAVFSSAPKTNEKDRGICSQPSANMGLQLPAHEMLREALCDWGLDLEDQQFMNRELAWMGSKGPTNLDGVNRPLHMCTVDLSRASNFPYVTAVYLLKDVPRFRAWFEMIRSPKMEIRSTGSTGQLEPASIHTKHMWSTMGNGFTFSLMTLFLSAIVRRLYLHADIPLFYKGVSESGSSVIKKTWAVYGDDIIVDRSVVAALFKVLTAIGFLINDKKSFYGPQLFRESCGGDYLDGYDVRPVFVETLNGEADIYSLINRLTRWGCYHSIPLPRSLGLLRKAAEMIRGAYALVIPNFEDDCAGIHGPIYRARHPESKAPPHLCSLRKEMHGGKAYRILEPSIRRRFVFREKVKRVHYTPLRCIVDSDYGPNIPRFEKIAHLSPFFNEVVEVRYLGQPNLPGLLQHMIGGYVENGKYSLRSFSTQLYEEKWKVTPAWGDPSLNGPSFGYDLRTRAMGATRFWEAYVNQNLFLTPTAVNYHA